MSLEKTLADRVRAALGEGRAAPSLLTPNGTAAPSAPERSCLLLDVSGSMSEHVEPGRSKWRALQDLLAPFAATARYAFSDRCERVRGALPPPSGGTNMAGAFRAMAAEGIRRVILITDGLPDDETDALKAARGLRIDILYVGPQPEPAFLARLAGATGGTRQSVSLKRDGVPQIVARTRQLLLLPPGTGATCGKAGELPTAEYNEEKATD